MNPRTQILISRDQASAALAAFTEQLKIEEKKAERGRRAIAQLTTGIKQMRDLLDDFEKLEKEKPL